MPPPCYTRADTLCPYPTRFRSGNHVLASIMEAAGLMQFDVVAACPQGYQPSEADLALGQGRARCVGNAREAVEGADVIVTATWISMGQDHADTKLAAIDRKSTRLNSSH